MHGGGRRFEPVILHSQTRVAVSRDFASEYVVLYTAAHLSQRPRVAWLSGCCDATAVLWEPTNLVGCHGCVSGPVFENRIDCACCTCRAPPSQAEGRHGHRESVDPATARYEQAPLGKTRGQVIKGTRWMPWYQEAMKDVGSCEKLRGAATQALIRRSPNGKTRAG